MVHLNDISCVYEVMGTMKTLVPVHKDDPVTCLSKRLHYVLLSDCPLAKSQLDLQIYQVKKEHMPTSAALTETIVFTLNCGVYLSYSSLLCNTWMSRNLGCDFL